MEVEKVVITHWHHDHVGGVLDLMRENVIDVRTPITKIPFPEKDDPTGLLHIQIDFLPFFFLEGKSSSRISMVIFG